MTALYTPRRSGARWREEAPPYILDCFDHPDEWDRYTVMFVPEGERRSFRDTWIPFLGLTPTGAWSSDELEAHQVAQYRYRQKHRRIRWRDLPHPVRCTVQAWWERSQ